MKVLFNAWMASGKAARKPGAVRKTIATIIELVSRVLPSVLALAITFHFTGKLAGQLIEQSGGATWALGIMIGQDMLRALTCLFIVFSLYDTRKQNQQRYLKAAVSFWIASIGLLALYSYMLLLTTKGMAPSPTLNYLAYVASNLHALVMYVLSFALCVWLYGKKTLLQALVDGWRFCFMEAPYLLVSLVCFLPLYFVAQPRYYPQFIVTNPWFSSQVIRLLVVVLGVVWYAVSWAIWIGVYRARKKVLNKKIKSTDALSDEY